MIAQNCPKLEHLEIDEQEGATKILIEIKAAVVRADGEPKAPDSGSVKIFTMVT